MGLFWCYAPTGTQEGAASVLEEEARARAQNGHVDQPDWWAIHQRIWPDNYEVVHSNAHQYLLEATPDERHVACLLLPEANMGLHDMEYLMEKVPFDGSSILALYVQALAELLEKHFAAHSTSGPDALMKDGKPDFDLMGTREDKIRELANIWPEHEQTLAFDAGRMQLLYAELERWLEAKDAMPHWFIPSEALLPFHGRVPDCDVTFYDFTVFKVPPKPAHAAPKTSGLVSRLKSLISGGK